MGNGSIPIAVIMNNRCKMDFMINDFIPRMYALGMPMERNEPDTADQLKFVIEMDEADQTIRDKNCKTMVGMFATPICKKTFAFTQLGVTGNIMSDLSEGTLEYDAAGNKVSFELYLC